MKRYDVNISVAGQGRKRDKVKHAYQDNRTIYRVSLLGAGPFHYSK